MRNVRVKDPSSTVIIKSKAPCQLVIPCQDGDDVHLVKRGDKARLSWGDYVTAKNRPGFGHMIELDDSVTITSDGYIKISDSGNKLTEESMVELLVLGLETIKEDIIKMTTGERALFKNFLESRVDLDIEVEKCVLLLEYIDRIDSPLVVKTEKGSNPINIEKVEPPVPPKSELEAEAVAYSSSKSKRGRKKSEDTIVKEVGEDSLAFSAKRPGDSVE